MRSPPIRPIIKEMQASNTAFSTRARPELPQRTITGAMLEGKKKAAPDRCIRPPPWLAPFKRPTVLDGGGEKIRSR
jgi:hypothetical protein